MKKLFVVLLLLCLSLTAFACGGKDVVLTEDTFFYGMLTIQMYPDEYVGKKISFDCFTYRLTDTDGNELITGYIGYMFRRAEGKMCVDGQTGLIDIDYFQGVRAYYEEQYRVEQWTSDIRFEDTVYAYRGALE